MNDREKIEHLEEVIGLYKSVIKDYKAVIEIQKEVIADYKARLNPPVTIFFNETNPLNMGEFIRSGI